LAVDPSEKFLYVTNSVDNTLSVLAIDPQSGALASIGSPIATGGSPISVTVHPSGFVYVSNLQANNISAYSVDPSTGVPTQITNSPFGTSGGPVFITVDSGGKFLFVCGESSETISEFSIDSKTGSLTSSSGSATLGSAPTSMFTTK
jgi:6-phosphogluconolactonase